MALKWDKASKWEQGEARRLRDRIADQDLTLPAGETGTVSQIIQDLDKWRRIVAVAEREAKQAAAKAAEEAAAKDAAEAAKATLTPATLAAVIGCAYSTARRWLRGINHPSPRYAAALALAGIAL